MKWAASIPARLAIAWLSSAAVLAVLAWDPGFAAAMLMASSPFMVAAVAVASVFARRIKVRPLSWTMGAFVAVTLIGGVMVGPLILLSFFVSVPTALLFLLSFPLVRRYRPGY